MQLTWDCAVNLGKVVNYCAETLFKKHMFFYLKGKVTSLCNKLLVERCESYVRVSNLATALPVVCEASGGVNHGLAGRGYYLSWGGPGHHACALVREGCPIDPADALEWWCLQKAALSSPGSFP